MSKVPLLQFSAKSKWTWWECGVFFVFCLFVFLAVSSCVVGILFCLFIYFIVGLEMTKESSLDSHVLPSEVKDPIKARECADHWKCHLLRGCMKSGDCMWVLSWMPKNHQTDHLVIRSWMGSLDRWSEDWPVENWPKPDSQSVTNLFR